MPSFTVTLKSAASDMAREEISKQVAFLSKSVRNVRFSGDGTQLQFDAAEADGSGLQTAVEELANRVSGALRRLQRKVVFASRAMEAPRFFADPSMQGVHFMDTGQVALSGLPLALFAYFDRVFESFGDPWQAAALRTPTLIPTRTLSRCDYFRSFPHNVTFASHLREDGAVLDAFRARHQNLDTIDDLALADMDRPEACLSPAVCYHVYAMHQNETLPAEGLAYGICGKCFRYESSNLRDLRRLWDFTMREVVFLGGRELVLAHRERSIAMMSEFLETHQLAGEIRTASDPFFIAPDAVSKTYFQLSSDSKFEVSLLLPENERLAVGSHNYHSDFFGRAFTVDIEGSGPMHSVCVAFGLERWVYAFLMQHGHDPKRWPEVMHGAPEFARFRFSGE